MKKYLEAGDRVEVRNPLGNRIFPVLSIEGEKAITKFRTFNRKVYLGRFVYEHGKRFDGRWHANSYVVMPKEKSDED